MTLVSTKPKKSLSQNFLTHSTFRENLVAKIQKYPEYQKATKILEIGPGNGELTEFLLNSGKPLLALEIDSVLTQKLNQRFVDKPNFEVLNTDAFLEFSTPDQLKNLEDFVLVSNLPFKVASRILVEMATFFPDTDFFVIMQKEVCQKTIFAKSSLTFFGAWMNLFWEAKKILDISGGNFFPKPKVVSTLIFGKSRHNQWLKNSDQKIVARNLLKALFAQPNKTVRNNLLKLGYSSDQIDTFLRQNDLPVNTRLTWQNYEFLLELALQKLPKLDLK